MLNFETEDVKGEFERIKASGAEVVAEPYAPGGGDGMLMCTFADPEATTCSWRPPGTRR